MARTLQKALTYFHFLCRADGVNDALLSLKGHFLAILSRRLLAYENVKTLILLSRIADTCAHMKLTESTDFVVVLTREQREKFRFEIASVRVGRFLVADPSV